MVNKVRKVPMRSCIGCGETKEKKTLVRIVKTPDDEIFLDRKGRANGRGAYICDDPSCLMAAKKHHGLERAFQMQISEEIYASLAKELQEHGSE